MSLVSVAPKWDISEADFIKDNMAFMNMATQEQARSTDIQVIARCTMQPGTVNTENHNQVAELVYRKGTTELRFCVTLSSISQNYI